MTVSNAPIIFSCIHCFKSSLTLSGVQHADIEFTEYDKSPAKNANFPSKNEKKNAKSMRTAILLT